MIRKPNQDANVIITALPAWITHTSAVALKTSLLPGQFNGGQAQPR